MTILAVGIDLAKHVFAVPGINEADKAELVRLSVARDKLHELIATLPACLNRGWMFVHHRVLCSVHEGRSDLRGGVA